jgi:hypothetical protein
LTYYALGPNNSLTQLAGAPANVGSYEVAANFAGSPDYVAGTAITTFNITPVTLTVTANDVSKVYGQANPAFAATITGFVNGETAAVVSGSAGLSTSATTGSGIGQYTITAALGSLSAANYTFAFHNGTLTVTPAPLTVTADAKTKVYGQANPALTFTLSGFVNGDTAAVVSGSPTLSTAATTGSGVGSYAITVVDAGTLSAANYAFPSAAFVGGTLTVTRAHLTVTANPATKVYGQANPAFTASLSGFVNGDTASVVSGVPTLSTPASASSGVGNYPITVVDAGNLAAANYDFPSAAFVGGTLTVTALSITVTPTSGQGKVYGDSDPTLAYTFTPALVGSDTFSGSLARAAGGNVGDYAISQGSLALSNNYALVFTSGVKFHITARSLVVTPDSGQGKVYGAGDPSLTYGHGALYNGDTDSVFSGALARAAGENVGSYAITQGTLSAGSNYAIAFTSGVPFAITARSLTVTPDAGQGKTYGAADPTLTYSHGTLYNGDTNSVFSGKLARSSGENVGSYTITQGNLTAGSNYTIVFTSGVTFGITARSLTVTPNSGQSKIYGLTDPTLTYTHGTLYNGDTDSVFSGTLSRVTGENVGTYSITQGTLSAGSNYAIVFGSGVPFAITPRSLTVTADAKTKVYGQANPALTLTLSGFVNGDTASVVSGAPTLSTAAATGSAVGSYAITVVDAGTLSAANYAFPSTAFVGGTLTVTRAHLTVTANPATKVYGQANPALTFTLSGFVNGDTASVVSGVPTLSSTASASSGVGNYPITVVNAGTLAAANYDFPSAAFVGGTLTVTARSITVTPDSGQGKVYGAGNPTLTYSHGALVNGDTDSVFSGALARAAGENVGSYAITQGTLSAGSNYAIVFTSGVNFAITRRNLTVTADAKTKVYGQTNPALTYTLSGFANGDTAAVVSGSPTLSPAATTASGVGSYAITVVDAGTLAAANYAFPSSAFVNGTLTVTRAHLTVTANAASKVYGQANPTLTVSLSGFVNGDTAAVVSGAPTLSTTAITTSPVGTYPITVVNAGTLAAANYDFPSANFVSGSLTVAPDATTTTASSSGTNFGQGVTLTATVTANAPGSGTPTGSVDFFDATTNTDLGSVTLSGGSASLTTTTLPAGSQTITTTYSGDGNFLSSTGTVAVNPANSIYVLNPTASGALSLSNNSTITIPGQVVVDSSSASALTESGNARITAAAIRVVGNVQLSGQATLGVTPQTGVAAVPDPLAGLPSPNPAGLTNHGAVNLTSGSLTLNPGIYTQIQVSNSASLTLNPGVYIIEGGGFTVTGSGSLNAQGVLIYNAGSNYPNSGGTFGGITLSGNGTFHLTPAATGVYAGMVFFQSRQNTRALAISANAGPGISGTIYAANALLTVSGNASMQVSLVVGMLSASSNTSLTEMAAGSNGSGDTLGVADTLLAGNLLVYVNDPNGAFSPAERARITDAISGWDALLAPYSVSITEVGDAAAANLVLDISPSSACGGQSDGVLGCYNPDAAEITLIQGWNWYAGSNPSQIGAGQYDFQTTVTHELGHAFGLGHSPDTTSPMHGTLPTGAVHRVMTVTDLNLTEAPDGVDPEMAAPGSGAPETGGSWQAAFAWGPGTTAANLSGFGTVSGPAAVGPLDWELIDRVFQSVPATWTTGTDDPSPVPDQRGGGSLLPGTTLSSRGAQNAPDDEPSRDWFFANLDSTSSLVFGTGDDWGLDRPELEGAFCGCKFFSKAN